MVELHPDVCVVAPRLFQGLRLSEDDAAGGAPRRLAAGRRIAGERFGFRAPAASDFYGISAAIMNPLSPTGQGDMNVELSVAMASAANDAQLESWTRRYLRLKSSVVVPMRSASRRPPRSASAPATRTSRRCSC